MQTVQVPRYCVSVLGLPHVRTLLKE